ncbi:FAD-binding protein [Bacillus suaedae]|uniref:FAD-binding protein n=1 Tax=Halalkalibacter suaedae TaxID=2822140 RepID=A0A941AP02_9BACI|nr:FAD-binding protein [Bacillus suaedae]MBP3950937.1 FAD-binding protein [Bacillus suaedae]
MKDHRNWAGNYQYHAERLHVPETIEEVQKIVASSSSVKVVGTRHSFNSIADTNEDHISLERLNRVVSLDRDKQTVTVEGGITYGDLSKYLHLQGLALPNLASLPHISVAGACATATHGSGDGNQSLATSVRTMEVVTAEGDVVSFSRDEDPEIMDGVSVGLGGLGVVTQLTLDVIPSFQIRQLVYENLSMSQLENELDAITSSAYSVSLFTDWKNESFNQVWLKQQVVVDNDCSIAPDFFEATATVANVHPVPGQAVENCTEQMGVAGEWHDRLPHFKMDFLPSSGKELQTEYIMARERAYTALQAIAPLKEEIAPLLQISEIRTIAKDELWMSPYYKRESVGFHFTWKDNWEEVQKVLPKIEERLAQFDARPHWGKLFTMAPDKLQSLYEKLPDFQKLLKQYDPTGKFQNEFLKKYIFGEE